MGLQDATIQLLSRIGIARLARSVLVANRRFVLMFHGVIPERYPDIPRAIQPWTTVAELRFTLAWLQARFAFLTPVAFFAGKGPGVLLTFDDGLANNYRYALPVLEAFDAPAIFFVATQHVKNPADWLPSYQGYAQQYWGRVEDVPREIGAAFWDGMSVEQVAACAQHPLITIGGHTDTHPHLTGCSDDELHHELTMARMWLQSACGRAVDLFAYPYGDYDRRVMEAVRTAGYRAAFVDQPVRVGVPEFEIPRVGLYYADPAYLDVKVSGLYRRPV
jgi:peptidoglycan/xylan/chitin deacetylase (PgdA/CDA1 family)